LRKVPNLLRIFAFLSTVFFAGNAFAAGYTCPTYLKYTSCASGYYMTASSTSTACAPTPAAGNACRACSVFGSNYTCAGGTACPASVLYTVTLDDQGGWGGGASWGDQGSFQVSYGQSMQGLDVYIPTRDGYKFVGYNEETYLGEMMFDSYGVSLFSTWPISNDTTLYAQWTPTTVAVTYNLNGGSGTAPSATTCNVGSSCALNSGATTSYYRAGYVLSGWSTSSGATSGSFSITTSSAVTVYAVWTACSAGTFKTSSSQAVAACTACSSLTGVSPSGGTYTTTSTASTDNTACKYTAPSKTLTGCATVTSQQVTYTGSGWPASTYGVTANAGYIIANNNTSSATCSICGLGTYSAGGSVTSCSSCSALTGVSPSGGTYTTSTTGSSANTACKYTAPTKTITGCTTVTSQQVTYTGSGWPASTYGVIADSGYIIANNNTSTATCSACSSPTFSTGGTATTCIACNSLPGVNPSGGTYTSVSPYNANTTCRYTAPTKTITGCATVTSQQVTYTGSAWPASTYGVTANAGYIIANNNASTATCSQCSGAVYSAGGTATSCTACPTNYTANTTGGKTAASQCQIQTTSGNYIATPNDTTLSTCPAGYFCPATLVTYGYSGDLEPCEPGTYSLPGWAGCSNCAVGSYSGDTSEECIPCQGGTTTSNDGYTECDINCSNYTGYETEWDVATWDFSENVTNNLCTVISCAAGYGISGDTCSPITYLVTLDAQGGTGGTASVIAPYNSAMPTATMPTLTNYVFVGYYDAISGGTQYYTSSGASARVWDKTSGATLYAHWTQSSATCDPGQYLPGNSSTCSTCTAGNYCLGGVFGLSSSDQGITACTTLGSNYTSSVSGSSANTACYIPNTILTADKYISTANSNIISTCSSGTYRAAGTYYYGAAIQSCTSCSNKPSAASYVGTGSGANACPWSLTCSAGNYFLYNTTETSRACSACTAGNYCAGVTATNSTATNTGLSTCPTNYVNGGTGVTTQTGCKWQTTAGNYIATANATTATTCTAGNYCPSTLVSYGSTGGLTTCPTNYVDGGTGLTDQNQCQIQTTAGTYIANANDTTATTCTAGNYCPSALILYGNTNSPTECPANNVDGGIGLSSQDQCAINCPAGTYVDGIDSGDLGTCITCPAGYYCPGELVYYGTGIGGGNYNCPVDYINGGTGLTSQSQCAIICTPGQYVSIAGHSCTVLSTNDKYIDTNTVTYGNISILNTCDTSSGYHITGKTLPIDHDSVNDCYQTCSTVSIAPPTGAVKTPKNTTENYPNYCVYLASCPGTYIPTPGGYHYDNSGYTSDPICLISTTCSNSYEMVNGVCQPCDRDNAVSYKSGNNCEVESCVSGYHPNGQSCEENTIDCSVSNAESASKIWNTSKNSYSTCKVQTCVDGYHVSSNTCVPDEQDCVIDNGSGTKEWNSSTNSWGACQVKSCNPGYTSEYSETNDHTKPCGQCKNKYSILNEPAVSSYARGCEIASCMYQGELYNLDHNQCDPICDISGYEDDTGTMIWNSSTKKCNRQCKDGYTMWPSYGSYDGGSSGGHDTV